MGKSDSHRDFYDFYSMVYLYFTSSIAAIELLLCHSLIRPVHYAALCKSLLEDQAERHKEWHKLK